MQDGIGRSVESFEHKGFALQDQEDYPCVVIDWHASECGFIGVRSSLIVEARISAMRAAVFFVQRIFCKGA
jgi:hypothetical protein